MKLPPPPKWNRLIDGIETMSSVEYERSILPPDIIFPRMGEIWETTRDCEAHCVATVSNRFHSVTTAILRPGERVRILELDEPKPVQVTFVPVQYQELEESIVPPEIRTRSGYSHYVLYLKVARPASTLFFDEQPGYFIELFRRIEASGGPFASSADV